MLKKGFALLEVLFLLTTLVLLTPIIHNLISKQVLINNHKKIVKDESILDLSK